MPCNGIDLEIKQGECFGLLGPNGAGKTTTVEILEGLNQPDLRRGRGPGPELGVPMRSRSASGSASRSRRRGFPTRRRCTRSSRCSGASTRPALNPDDVIARVSLESKANAFIEQLSGGQQQRLAVALALVGDPEVLFLDEPTTGLDPQSRRQLWDVIRDLRDRGRTIVLTTHYMDEAERLCDRVAIIDHGKIIAQGSPAELIARLGGDHIVEFALESRPTARTLGRRLVPGLDSVLAARVENDGYVLTVAEPHRAIPALLDELDRQRAAPGPPDDAARQSRGRLRLADRPPPARR